MVAKQHLSRNKVFYVGILILFVVGVLLRVLHLNHYPAPVNQDELSNIYDGYSIAKTGADRWGQKFPVILRGFGPSDFRPPMYAWLSAITIQVLGFSVTAGRLVSAILGSVSLLLIYLVAARIGGKRVGLLALLVAVLSPWHILFSRMGSEGAMLPAFFLIASCYLWQVSSSRAYMLTSLLPLGLCIGLGTNTYQAGKLMFFLFAVAVLIDIWRSVRKPFKETIAFGLTCLIGAAPQIVALLSMPDRFFSRANGVALKFEFSFDFFNALLRNIFSNFSPDFLFFQFGSYNNLSVGRLLMVECLFLYVGIFLYSRIASNKQVIGHKNFLFLLFLTALPSSLTTDNPHALRSSGLVVLLPIVTAVGIMALYNKIQSKVAAQAFFVVAIGLLMWNGWYSLDTYIRDNDMKYANMQPTLVEASKKLNQYKDNYNTIYIEPAGNQFYIYILTYCNISPAEFQAMNKEYRSDAWDDFQRMGKYRFLPPAELEAARQQDAGPSLALLRNRNKAYTALDSVDFKGDKMYFYRVR